MEWPGVGRDGAVHGGATVGANREGHRVTQGGVLSEGRERRRKGLRRGSPPPMFLPVLVRLMFDVFSPSAFDRLESPEEGQLYSVVLGIGPIRIGGANPIGHQRRSNLWSEIVKYVRDSTSSPEYICSVTFVPLHRRIRQSRPQLSQYPHRSFDRHWKSRLSRSLHRPKFSIVGKIVGTCTIIEVVRIASNLPV